MLDDFDHERWVDFFGEAMLELEEGEDLFGDFEFFEVDVAGAEMLQWILQLHKKIPIKTRPQ